jgi:hypothetical protein
MPGETGGFEMAYRMLMYRSCVSLFAAAGHAPVRNGRPNIGYQDRKYIIGSGGRVYVVVHATVVKG